MPAKMGMFFENSAYNNRAITAYLQAMKAAETQHKKKMGQAGGLNGSMVGRIFYAKPGCGSCGK